MSWAHALFSLWTKRSTLASSRSSMSLDLSSEIYRFDTRVALKRWTWSNSYAFMVHCARSSRASSSRGLASGGRLKRPRSCQGMIWHIFMVTIEGSWGLMMMVVSAVLVVGRLTRKGRAKIDLIILVAVVVVVIVTP